VPKILVADDNSNIQKMVALALKDQGIEVVGVSHGEAAVRKLPDVQPDLILADVFMPVRNGYEVCEFVKNDPRFAHIPVVLLVGAFDPVDDHEVKRVKADGKLYKPFEPIDKLMEMVKFMLAKSAEAKAAAAAPKPPAPPVGETVELSPDEMRALTQGRAAPELAVSPPPGPEPPVEDYAVRPQRLEFAETEQPVAFAEDLIATPPAAALAGESRPVAEEKVFRASSLGEEEPPVAAPEAEVEVETGEPAEASASSAYSAEAPVWGGIEAAPREPAPDEPPIAVSFESAAAEELEIVREEPFTSAYADISPPPELVTSAAEFLAEPPPPIAASIPTAEDWVPAEPAPAPSAEAPPAEAISAPPAASELPPPEISLPPAPEPPAFSPAFAQVPLEIPETPPPVPPGAVEEVAAAPIESLGTPSFAEVSTTLAPSPELAAAEAAAYAAPPLPEVVPQEIALPEAPSAPPEPVVEMAAPEVAPSSAAVEAPAPPPPAVEEAPRPRPMFTGDTDALSRPKVDEALVNAVANRVVQKIQGGILDKLTKDILRPIIEALIAQELDKKS
jgi:CheY-like chemotaxis protein